MAISTISQAGLNSPLALTSPNLGTPSALVLTNATGLPATSGISGVLPTANGGTGNTAGITSFKNKLINGSFIIDQRFSGGATSPTGDAYVVDRWQAAISSASAWISYQQTGSAPAGFWTSLKCTSTGANSPSSGTISVLQQRIEGTTVADLNFGTANAKTVTISFWAYSSLTGTFGGLLTNGSMARAYPFTYVITNANSWTYCTVTIPGDTTGTWATDTGIGMRLVFQMGTGSSYSITQGSGWGTYSGGVYGVTGTVNLSATNGAYMYYAGVQLEEGTAASRFDNRPYPIENMLCLRYYYQPGYAISPTITTDSSGRCLFAWQMPVPMRSGPSFSLTRFNTRGADGFIYYPTGNTSQTTSLTCQWASNSFDANSYFGTTQFYGMPGSVCGFIIFGQDSILKFNAEL